MTQKEQIVDLLLANGNKMNVAEMERQLKIDCRQIQTHISGINHNRTKWNTIQIHRTGKNGNSSYEIQNSVTPLDVVLHTQDREATTAIKLIANHRDITLKTIANTQNQRLRQELVAQLSARQSAMIRKVLTVTQ